jgi:LuxR family maltose regulon positive regulatory protein
MDRSPTEVFTEAARNAAVNELLQAEYFTVIRLVLAQSHPQRALEMLSFLHDMVKVRGYQRRIIEILALKALALDQIGSLDESLQTLNQAFTLAEPEGYQRIFVDEGEPMARLLYKAVAQSISPAYCNKLLNVLLAERENSRWQESTFNGKLVEPLSSRELEVLHLIDNGLSNGEIAGQLFISLSTVKGHTTNIFGKLNVKNRTQAVARAHDLGLLPVNKPAR